jgi:hypothetical protein
MGSGGSTIATLLVDRKNVSGAQLEQHTAGERIEALAEQMLERECWPPERPLIYSDGACARAYSTRSRIRPTTAGSSVMLATARHGAALARRSVRLPAPMGRGACAHRECATATPPSTGTRVVTFLMG